jgi:antitoxin FitA
MTAMLQIRNVPDEARRVLKARAAARGESLNRFLLSLIDQEVSRPSVEDVLARGASRTERATASALDAVHDGRAEREVGAGRRSTR